MLHFLWGAKRFPESAGLPVNSQVGMKVAGGGCRVGSAESRYGIMAAKRKTTLRGCQQRGYLIDRISPRAPQVWELLLCCSVELFY